MFSVEQRHLSLAKELADTFGNAARVQVTTDVAQVDIGGEGEGAVVYLFLPETVEIRHRMVSWPLPHAPVMTTRIWRRLRAADADLSQLMSFYAEARNAWTRKLRRCHHCREKLSPGYMMRLEGRTMCHACATEHHGVLY